MLTGYAPLLHEGDFTLWKRAATEANSASLTAEVESSASLDQWIPISNQPTWLRVELKRTWLGSIQSLLWTSTDARIEVQLEDGAKSRYRLPPGCARSGFLVNPLLMADGDLLRPAQTEAKPTQVKAVRIYSSSGHFFRKPIRIVKQEIQGLPQLPLEGPGGQL